MQHYVGRVVAIARTRRRNNAVLYQLASQKYPERQMMLGKAGPMTAVRVQARPGFEGKFAGVPYLFYPAICQAGDWVFAGNGDHVGDIAASVLLGEPISKAISQVLNDNWAEEDDEKTPRLVVAAPTKGHKFWVGKVTEGDGIIVRPHRLQAGRCALLHLDEWLETAPYPFDVSENDAILDFLRGEEPFSRYSDVVAVAAAVYNGEGFSFFVANRSGSNLTKEGE